MSFPIVEASGLLFGTGVLAVCSLLGTNDDADDSPTNSSDVMFDKAFDTVKSSTLILSARNGNPYQSLQVALEKIGVNSGTYQHHININLGHLLTEFSEDGASKLFERLHTEAELLMQPLNDEDMDNDNMPEGGRFGWFSIRAPVTQSMVPDIVSRLQRLNPKANAATAVPVPLGASVLKRKRMSDVNDEAKTTATPVSVIVKESS